MTELLTAAQMRAIEQAAIASGEVTGLELMERAGRGVVEAVFEEWPELAATSHRAVVLCGPGNNGGDGFVVARLLKEWGWQVEVFLYGDAEKLPPDARVNYERWGELGEVRKLEKGAIYSLGTTEEPDFLLWVDALFGTGLTRPIADGALGEALRTLSEIVWVPDHYPNERIVAVDIPSGVCADSGLFLQEPDAILHENLYVLAHLTVSLDSQKLGHVLAAGPAFCGKVVVKSIGLKEKGSDRPRGGVKRPPGGAVGRCPAVPPGEVTDLLSSAGQQCLWKQGSDHKYTHGHALILSGPSGRGGAARLAARGALRIGAGLVTVGCPPEAVAENAAQLNAIMLTPVHDADALARVLEDGRINALCLGPGLGADRARELLPVALETGRPCVMDADALSILFFDEADALFGKLHDKCVLTPHAGEFARMFPDIAGKLEAPATKGPAYSKVDATREAAARAGCVVLFKGPDTVIASPDGRCSVNSAAYERAAPWLATAGSGDVLAGFIAGLLARGVAPMQAAETAAWLHVECARNFGPGLIAEDLPETLPEVLRSLEV